MWDRRKEPKVCRAPVKSLRRASEAAQTEYQSKVAFGYKNPGWATVGHLVPQNCSEASPGPSLSHLVLRAAAWSPSSWGHLTCLCWSMEPGQSWHREQEPAELCRGEGLSWGTVFVEANRAFIGRDGCSWYPKMLPPKAASQVWALKAGLQKGWAPPAAGSGAGGRRGKNFLTLVEQIVFFWFSFQTDFLACPPTPEVLPHPQGAALQLLLLTWVFPEDSSTACTGERHWVLPPVCGQ